MYFGSNDSNLYALDAAKGTLRWKFKTHGRITSSPAVADGRVYFGSYDGIFYALDAEHGTLRVEVRHRRGAALQRPTSARRRAGG